MINKHRTFHLLVSEMPARDTIIKLTTKICKNWINDFYNASCFDQKTKFHFKSCKILNRDTRYSIAGQSSNSNDLVIFFFFSILQQISHRCINLSILSIQWTTQSVVVGYQNVIKLSIKHVYHFTCLVITYFKQLFAVEIPSG